ncbi:mannose-1-phosphate guanylyltransferase/mannose-6-phosphate isomerase [Variibacter gotjawalensis]|nr:mannose-1-phosphate guanylyltransferase/mannose-6-phosphate isomerase [Variibacter gotjawalensis]
MSRLQGCGIEDFVLVTNGGLVTVLREDLEDAANSGCDIVLEPARRDSAPAIAAGVARIATLHGSDVTIAVLPSDHLIPDEAAFKASLESAGKVAGHGWLTTFGIRPTFPSTAFGYIERGAAIPKSEGAFAVTRFHEKPAQAAAERYLAAGTFDWNSGMFVFRADAFAREAAEHMPDIWTAASEAVANGVAEADTLTLGNAFKDARRTSIDFALMEKSARVATVPAAFGWSDVGNWSAVYDVLEKDASGNAVVGNAKLEDCKGSLVITDGIPAAAMGLRDAVLIATAEGTFTAPLSRAADIKQVLDSK